MLGLFSPAVYRAGNLSKNLSVGLDHKFGQAKITPPEAVCIAAIDRAGAMQRDLCGNGQAHSSAACRHRATQDHLTAGHKRNSIMDRKTKTLEIDMELSAIAGTPLTVCRRLRG